MGFLSPINYLFFKFLPLPINIIESIISFCYVVLGSFFAGQLIKEFKGSPLASLTASYACVFLFFSMDITIFAAVFIMSFSFWLVTYIYNHNSWLIMLLGSIVIGAGWLSAHSNYLLIAMSGLAVYVIFLFFSDIKNYKFAIKIFVLFSISSFIGLIQIIPNLVSLSVSGRGGSIFQEYVVSAGIFKFGVFLTPLFPLIDVIYLDGGTIKNYIGILPLIFLVSTIFLPKNKLIVFWQIFALGFFLITIPYSPLFWLINYLPIISQLRSQTRWMLPAVFSLVVLSGLGLDFWLDNKYLEIKRKIFNFFKKFIILLILLLLLINIVHFAFGEKILSLVNRYFDVYLYSQTKKLPLEHYHQVIKQRYLYNVEQLLFTNYRTTLQVATIIISLFCLAYFLKNNERKNYAAVILIVNMIGVIIIYFLYFDIATPIPATYYNYQPQTVKFVKNNPGKIFPFLQGQSEYEKLNLPYNPSYQDYFIFHSEIMAPMTNVSHKISSADSDDMIMPQRNARLIALIGSTRVDSAKITDNNLINLDTLEEKIEIFHQRQNLVDLLGINYIISVYPLIEDQNFTRVYTATTTAYQIPFYIYENKNPTPSVFLAEKVNYLEPNQLEKNLSLINQPENDFNQQAFIECSDCPQDFSADGKIEIVEKNNAKIEIAYEGNDNAWLIIGQDFLPGWEAKIDGQQANIYFADFVYQAIFIPLGKHQIITEYKYPLKYFLNHYLKFNLK